MASHVHLQPEVIAIWQLDAQAGHASLCVFATGVLGQACVEFAMPAAVAGSSVSGCTTLYGST